jgi:hypothetical protein
MYNKFFIATVIAFAAAIAAVSGAAAAQNQTSTMPASTATSNMTLDSIKDLYLSVWNQTEFNSTFSTFVEPYSAAGYGVYEEHGDTFAPGETIVLYVEPVGFNHMSVLDDRGNTLYLMNMTADYTIAGADGTELQSIEDVPVGSIISHRPNTELFFELTLTQESPFPAGGYLLTYVVTDEVSGESFALEKEITVAETVSSSVA